MANVNINNLDDLLNSLANLPSTVYRMGQLAFAAMITKSILSSVANKFFESESLPVKINYVDWWPHTKQKAQEFGAKFWAHRIEGATASSISGGALWLSWLYSDMHPTAKSVWNAAQKTTTACLNLFGFSTNYFGSDLVALYALPSVIGFGTSLALGSWEVISQYFDKDLSLETKPIFSPKLQGELDEILATTQTSKERNDFFQHLLVYGPPGTGKTMISKWIAKNSKMNYIYISGGDFLKGMNYSSMNPLQGRSNQGGAGAAVDMLQKLVEHVKTLPTQTVIFVDEAEACFENREEAKKNGKSQELVSFLNAFLKLSSSANSKIMWIFATNLPKNLDPAVLSRMDYKILIGPPELAERKVMIRSNVDLLVTPAELRRFFTPAIDDHISNQTEGFTGRDIFKLINRLKTEVRNKNALEISTIDRILKNYLKQEHQLEIQDNAENPLKKNPLYAQNNEKVAPKPIPKEKKSWSFFPVLLNN